MLVLGRKVGERIICTLPDGQEIKIIPVRLGDNIVRLGIEAAPDVLVDREEVKLAKKKTELITNG